MLGDIESIVVINPNSSERISAEMREALRNYSTVSVVTSTFGPAAIESDGDVEAAIDPLVATARGLESDAFIIGCFSDPGLSEVRAAVDVPVYGIAESAITEALRVGDRIGVISSVQASVPRHDRYWHRLGVADSIAGDIPVGLGVLELASAEAFERTVTAGKQLAELGADVVVLGCTGMSHMRARVEDALGIPVVDPCDAAAGRATRILSEGGGP